jgi:hypothetical protein
LESIIEGLKEIKLIIQLVLLNGSPFSDWLSAILEIKLSFIQVYSVDRPVAEGDCQDVRK